MHSTVNGTVHSTMTMVIEADWFILTGESGQVEETLSLAGYVPAL